MPSKNRLGELQVAFTDNENEKLAKKNKKPKIKKKECSQEAEKEVENVFDKLEVIQKWIGALTENTEKCETIYKNHTKVKGLSKKLKDIFKNSETISYNIAANLKIIHQTLKSTENKTSAEYRMHFVRYSGLVEQFKQAVADQESWAQNVHDIEKTFILKCSQIANQEAPNDDELNQLIGENPQMFTQNYVENEIEARRQLAEIEERHQQLLAIEEHLTEVRDLFVQIGTLVEMQQESINTVEFFTAQASEYIEDTAHELDKAKKLRKRKFKLKIILLVVGIVVAAVILAAIFC